MDMKPNEILEGIQPIENLRSTGIYMIFCTVSGKAYIGQAKNIYKRWVNHRYDLRHKIHGNPHLQKTYDKYGLDKLAFIALENCKNLTEREGHYLELLDKDLRINCNPVSDSIPISEETRRKISKSLKGKQTWWLGRKHSDESRKKISEAGKSRPPREYKKASPERRAKLIEVLNANREKQRLAVIESNKRRAKCH